MSGYEDLARLATIRPLTRPMKLGGRFSPFKAGWPSTVNLLVKELRAHGARNVVLGFMRFLGLARVREAVRLCKDPTWGDASRKRLQADYDRFLAASEGREVAALVSGRGVGALGHFDPLAALGVRPARGELEAGERA